jgi:steroid 5-alpha reductase family enzyme
MTYIQIYLLSLIVIQVMMALLWLVSVRLKNVSIVDPFWGLGFVVVTLLYFMKGEGLEARKILERNDTGGSVTSRSFFCRVF